jgi:phage terminase small subunit
MKVFNASDMAHKRTEIFEAARDDGAILQKKNTNGEVLEEFVMVPREEYEWLSRRAGSYRV